jgi:uncharacterized membrane protein
LDTVTSTALTVATVLAGLKAGLLFAYSCSVMPGLRRVDDPTFVAVMRSINYAILNPWFALVYVGAPISIAAALALDVLGDGTRASLWIAAGLVFAVASLTITARVNLPLNRVLQGSSAPAVDLRERFERRWIRANHLRALTSTAALAALTLQNVVA